jgi:hypothetical protein
MSKLINDKYYTSPDLAQYIVTKTKEVIGDKNITEYIEPSAGAGAFLNYLDKPYIAYDIEPEDDRIIKQDYLRLELDYKKGRCVIGNPPYGYTMNLAVQFYKKSILLGDYVAFILPISQLNNNYRIYEFDLIYSEDLGIKYYSNIEVHCCLNIYKRPSNGIINKKPNYNLKEVKIDNYDRGRNDVKNLKEYDIAICSFGSIGKVIKREDTYCQELYIKVNNNEYKDKVINLINNTDWKQFMIYTKTPKIQIWQLYKYIKEQIPGIQ